MAKYFEVKKGRLEFSTYVIMYASPKENVKEVTQLKQKSKFFISTVNKNHFTH